MIAPAIITAALLIIALLRFGMRIEYSSDGVLVELMAGPLRIKVYPSKKDDAAEGKKKKKKEKKEKKSARKKEKKKDAKPKKSLNIGFKEVKEIIPHFLKMLGRIKKCLLINHLTLYFTVGGEDAAKIAKTYGVVNAAVGELLPILDNNFRIKKRDIQFFTDFINQKQTIYANATFSLAVWEGFYIVFALFPILGIVLRRRPAKRADGKEDKINGKEANQ